MSSPVSVDVPQRCPDVWFEDGTVVIQAGSTLFRVYRGILSANSPVFSDMFSVPQPSEYPEVEGCAVVHLHDSPTDLRHFLKAIHNAGYYDRHVFTEFAVLAGILRLSTKYNVKYLRERAFKHLASVYPTDLDSWDQRATHDTIQAFHSRPFAVLQLAQENDLVSIFPAVMYCCAGTPEIENILDGMENYDGNHIEMGWRDKRSCLKARQSLIDAQRSRIFRFLRRSNDVASCRSRSNCDSGRLKWLQKAERRNSATNPFGRKFDWDAFQEDVCGSCFAASQSQFEAARRALWEDLPGIFDLPPWSELTTAME